VADRDHVNANRSKQTINKITRSYHTDYIDCLSIPQQHLSAVLTDIEAKPHYSLKFKFLMLGNTMHLVTKRTTSASYVNEAIDKNTSISSEHNP
jgi:hypothetical protein